MWEGVGDRTEPRFFPVLRGCSTGGPASQGAGFFYRILSPTRLIPNWLIGDLSAPSAGFWLSLPHLVPNWLNFLCTELYNSWTSTFFLWASQIALIQPILGQGYTLLFLDWMHLLFTRVHFLFWQPDRVVGQYTTVAYELNKETGVSSWCNGLKRQTAESVYASSYSSCAITFTFGQIPLGKVWTPLSSQLWVK